jgi:hypothetical protein
VVRWGWIGLGVVLAAVIGVRAQTPSDNPVMGPARVRPAVPAGPAEGRNAGGRPIHNEAERAARWKVVAMPYSRAGLTAAEQQMIAKLADALHLVDEIYLRQSDLGGYWMYHTTQSPELYRLFSINGSRWDLVDKNTEFIGEEPLVPGHELYPYGTTPATIERYVAAHPEQKDAIYSPWTVVRSAPLDLDPALSQPVMSVADKLYTYPYHEAYAEWVKPMAADLRAAAKLSPDAEFARYLNLRADALLTDDYYASDIAWLDLKDPKIDLIFAPYENYIDGVLGVKTSYGGSILIRNEAESRKLKMYQDHEAAMQQALPIGGCGQAVEGGLCDADGGCGCAAAGGRSAVWVPGGGGQSAERCEDPCGEGVEEDLLQELYGRAGELCDSAGGGEGDGGGGRKAGERRWLLDGVDSA